jgi:hypothetical protein
MTENMTLHLLAYYEVQSKLLSLHKVHKGTYNGEIMMYLNLSNHSMYIHKM